MWLLYIFLIRFIHLCYIHLDINTVLHQLEMIIQQFKINAFSPMWLSIILLMGRFRFKVSLKYIFDYIPPAIVVPGLDTVVWLCSSVSMAQPSLLVQLLHSIWTTHRLSVRLKCLTNFCQSINRFISKVFSHRSASTTIFEMKVLMASLIYGRASLVRIHSLPYSGTRT